MKVMSKLLPLLLLLISVLSCNKDTIYKNGEVKETSKPIQAVITQDIF